MVRLEADCGEGTKPLLLEIVATGDQVAALARQWRQGALIRASGSVRALPLAARRGLGIEVIAERVELDAETCGD
jgi:hypothetical protein